MKKLALLIAPLLVLLSACGGSSVKVNNLNADAFASDIKNPGVVVLDVRTAGEFAASHTHHTIGYTICRWCEGGRVARTCAGKV